MSDRLTSLPAPADILPHRPPFLFVDELLDLVPGDSVRARWWVDPESAFFAGHFPGNPILPGVILVEALAQAGALAVLALPEMAGKLALFGGIERARFRRVVRPGEDVLLEVRLTRRRGPMGEAWARASVEDVTACEGTLKFAIVDPERAG